MKALALWVVNHEKILDRIWLLFVITWVCYIIFRYIVSRHRSEIRSFILSLFLKFYKSLGKFLRQRYTFPWDYVADLTENVEYIVVGLVHANMFSNLRPMVVVKRDHVKGPMIAHNALYVEVRLLMVRTEELRLNDLGFIGLGDLVMRIGNDLSLQQKKFTKFDSLE